MSSNNSSNATKFAVVFGTKDGQVLKGATRYLDLTEPVQDADGYNALAAAVWRKREKGGLGYWDIRKENPGLVGFRLYPVPKDWEGAPNYGASIFDNPFGGYEEEAFSRERDAAEQAYAERKAAKAQTAKPKAQAQSKPAARVVVAACKSSGSPEAAAMLMHEAVPQVAAAAKPAASTITPKAKEIVQRIVAKLATKSEAELLLIEKMLG